MRTLSSRYDGAMGSAPTSTGTRSPKRLMPAIRVPCPSQAGVSSVPQAGLIAWQSTAASSGSIRGWVRRTPLSSRHTATLSSAGGASRPSSSSLHALCSAPPRPMKKAGESSPAVVRQPHRYGLQADRALRHPITPRRTSRSGKRTAWERSVKLKAWATRSKFSRRPSRSHTSYHTRSFASLGKGSSSVNGERAVARCTVSMRDTNGSFRGSLISCPGAVCFDFAQVVFFSAFRHEDRWPETGRPVAQVPAPRQPPCAVGGQPGDRRLRAPTRQLDFEIETRCADRDARVSRRHLLASSVHRLSDGSCECLRVRGAVPIGQSRWGDDLARPSVGLAHAVVAQKRVRSVARKIVWH